MRVILGASSLRLYVAAPKVFHVLGIVRCGMEYGLLATNAEGVYCRVNGSQSVALDSSHVHRAIERSYGAGGRLTTSSANYAATHANRNPLVIPTAPVIPQVIILKDRRLPEFTVNDRQSMLAVAA